MLRHAGFVVREGRRGEVRCTKVTFTSGGGGSKYELKKTQFFQTSEQQTSTVGSSLNPPDDEYRSKLFTVSYTTVQIRPVKLQP